VCKNKQMAGTTKASVYVCVNESGKDNGNGKCDACWCVKKWSLLCCNGTRNGRERGLRRRKRLIWRKRLIMVNSRGRGIPGPSRVSPLEDENERGSFDGLIKYISCL